MMEIRNALLPDGRRTCIKIAGDMIVGIDQSTSDRNSFIDVSGLQAVPALNLMHVHFRVPGGEHKEDWEHGTAAAIAGGVATVGDMPNTKPALTTAELLDQKIALVGHQDIRYRFWFGATADTRDQITLVADHPLVCGVKMFMGSSTGDLLVENERDQRHIFRCCARENMFLAVHAEHEPTIRSNRILSSSPSVAEHNIIRSPEAAAASTELALAFQRRTNCPLLILHASTVEELEMIKQAKDRGRPVYAEVCPHHWLFDDQRLASEQGAFLKMNPPLRSVSQQNRYLELIAEPGVVDFIAPDHAPHTIEEKMASEYDHIPSGIPGVQELFPLAYNLVRTGLITLKRFIQLTSTNAARVFGLPNGVIAPGYAADLVAFDPDEPVVIRNQDMKSKCGWSAYEGMEVYGAIKAVVVKGRVLLNRLG
jgi:dihydroorotase